VLIIKLTILKIFQKGKGGKVALGVLEIILLLPKNIALTITEIFQLHLIVSINARSALIA